MVAVECKGRAIPMVISIRCIINQENDPPLLLVEVCAQCAICCRPNDVLGTGDCLETQPRHPVIISQHKETPVAGNLNIYEMIVCAYYNVERH